MSTMPTDDRCQRFADYVVNNYMDIGCDFPVSLWVQSTDFNGAESFRRRLNDDINTPHPNTSLCGYPVGFSKRRR